MPRVEEAQQFISQKPLLKSAGEAQMSKERRNSL